MTGLPLLSEEFWRDKRVFLTGHTGFKGSWMVLVLRRLGAEVHGFSLAPDTSPSMFEALNLDSMCTTHQIADIRDANVLAFAVESVQPDVAIHMAAQPIVSAGYDMPLETFDTNVMGSANFLEACRKVKVPITVVVSSDKCYRNNEDGLAFTEDAPLGGHDPYSASKAATEIVVSAWASSYMTEANGMRLASARAGNVIGGGDWSRDRLITDAARAFAAGKTMNVRSPGSIRPWQHVLEPVCAYLLLAERLAKNPAISGPWNFGPTDMTGRPVRDVMDMAVEAWGEGAQWASTETSVMNEAVTLLLDSTHAHQSLGWSPRLSLKQAVRWTMDWYRLFYEEGPDAARIAADRQITSYFEIDC